MANAKNKQSVTMIVLGLMRSQFIICAYCLLPVNIILLSMHTWNIHK